MTALGFIHSRAILKAARVSAERARMQATQDPASPPPDAIAAIIMAAAATEAFANEVPGTIDVARAALPGTQPLLTPSLVAIGTVLSEAEDERASPILKVALLGHLLGRPFEKSINPFQDFVTLIQLRNDLLHLKQRDVMKNAGGQWSIELPKRIVDLQNRKLAALPRPGEIGSSLGVIQTHQMAKWACDTAEAIITAVVESMPGGPGEFGAATTIFHVAFNPKWSPPA